MAILGPFDSLAEMGLSVGRLVRFRPADGRRMVEAKVRGLEDDGSVRVERTDGKGGTRSIYPMFLERQVVGPRGGRRWRPVLDGRNQGHG